MLSAGASANSVGIAEVGASPIDAPTPTSTSVRPQGDRLAGRARGPAWRRVRRAQATAELHDLLLRAARFEINRRRVSQPHLRGDGFDDLAHSFTTWAYKFALLEAAVTLGRRAWQGRELPLEPEQWALIPGSSSSPADSAEQSELLNELQSSIDSELSAHQRDVLLAIAVNGVPIDVMAERLNTTRLAGRFTRPFTTPARSYAPTWSSPA